MTKTSNPHPPYIWFGGKRKVAPIVWQALGDVDHYVEPFFGGGSVWLLRPHAPKTETVNDYDGFIANFWRAVQAEPDAVAAAMNWPVNEVDLEARHRALCRMPDKAEWLERMKHDPALYDVERAAWWCWGLNAWIGRGWCGGEYWEDSGGGHGVHRQLPHLVNAGRGVHRKLPNLGNAGQGETARRLAVLTEWMRALADRLRNVRVCCGDWARVCTYGATSYGKTVGVFLDPPYSHDAGDRDTNIYRCESADVAHRVREWCLERTGNARYRIVLAGYDGEHNELEAHGWRAVEWKAQGGFANFGRAIRGKTNSHRERLWLSPSCLALDSEIERAGDMFAGLEDDTPNGDWRNDLFAESTA